MPKCFPGGAGYRIWEIGGNSLVVQWLRRHPLTAKDPGSISGRGTKIPPATQCGGGRGREDRKLEQEEGRLDDLAQDHW